MCGIAGIVGAGPPLSDLGPRMVAALRHRGPDADGTALLPGGKGVFAHTRLKIIDLSERAAQPFASSDGRVVLTFNGEIYNFKTLRLLLERRGVEFRSRSDTEVILEQYRAFGASGLDALDGMFAFALFDAEKERLILMRDRFGKKPLYWMAAPKGALLFASEPKAFEAHPDVTLALDPALLPEYLTYGYVSSPRSLLAGVRKLPPASRLVWDLKGEPRIERYWSLEQTEGAEPLRLPFEEAKAAVKSAIGRAVEKRMIADVPLGAFLSGGIDSSIVVAEMAARSTSPVRTFAVGFSDDATYDETKYAREVASLFGTDHTEIRVDVSPSALLLRLLDHHDEPYGDSSALAVFAVAEATKKHVTVVLTGDGGDEMFAGYTRFRGGLFAGLLPDSALRITSRILGRFPEPRGYKNPISLLRRFTEHAGRSADEQLLAWNSYFAGAELAALLRADRYGPSFDPWSVLRPQIALLEGRDRLDRILRHNVATYLLDDLLVKLDRMTMAVALEARSPFLDADLAHLAFRLPSSQKLRFGKLKGLLREAYRDLLPPSVLERKKHGFGVPVGKWWSGALKDMVDDLLLAPHARAAEYLEASAIRRIVEEHRANRRDHAQRIFALLQLELWLRARRRAERSCAA